MTRLILLALVPLLAAATVLAWVRLAWCILFSPARGWKLAVSFDQLANTATNGHEDETISSRAARARDGNRRWGCVLCKLLDFVDPNHCHDSRGV